MRRCLPAMIRRYIYDRNRERALSEWVNTLYTNKAATTIQNGVEGKGWRYAEEGEVGFEGRPALWAANGIIISTRCFSIL